MRKIIPICAILLLGSIVPAIGQTNVNSIRWGSTGDPLNGLTIGWSSQGTTDSIAWGLTSGLENGVSAAVMSAAITGTLFEYTFPALTAGSTIHYALFDSQGNEWLETRTYNTASDASDNQFTFSVIGDSRSYPDEWKKIADAVLDTDFSLFLGDIIADGAQASQWPTWFEYGDKFVSRELVYHTVGNHDDDHSPSGFDNFMSLYTLPNNELYYSFTYGNAVFICLNSVDASDTDQYNWLLSTLEANNDKTWKIVFTHKPFYTAPSHTGEMDGYFNTWWKAFDDYGVDLIFNGHTHNYQRTVPINRNVSTDSPVENYGSGEGEGRCQIVAGSAGPLSGVADPSYWWLDNSASLRHFCTIDIDGDGLIFKVMGSDLVVFDSLELNKSSSEINFQVDLSEVPDLYEGGAVEVVFGARDSSFVMTDSDGNGIYTYSMRVPFETEWEYYFAYQTGANPDTDINEESVPAECSNAEGYRVVSVEHGNITLPPVLFGSCIQASQDVTFQVDLGQIADLHDGGAVWLAFGAWDSSFVMTDPDNDSIYTYTLSIPAGTDLKYFFSYQNGANPDTDYVEEFAPAECGDAEGYRLLQVPREALILPAIMFGACIEDPGPQPDISIQIIRGDDDGEEVMTKLGTGDPQGDISLGSSDLELIFDKEPQYVGMLFRNVQIPPNADISNANVQFTVDAVKPGVTDADINLNVYGAKEATVNAITSAPFNISSHPPTTAMVSWSPGPSVAVGDATEAEQTPDISTVIQEIVSLDGWTAGNNILIIIKGDPYQTVDKNREYESYNGSASSAPVLNIWFTESTVGVKSMRGEFSSSIYPNPAKGKIYIDNPAANKFSYDIYSISGRLVSSKQNITVSTAEVDMSNVAKGLYIIKVRTADRSETHKLILK